MNSPPVISSSNWHRGGFAVDNATLTRFFSLHFLLPFVVAGLRIVHLLFLHQTGRNNPLGINRNFDKVAFDPYFSTKDVFGFIVILIILRSIPNKLGGVVALALSIVILIICPFIYIRKFRGYIFYPLNKILFLNSCKYLSIVDVIRSSSSRRPLCIFRTSSLIHLLRILFP